MSSQNRFFLFLHETYFKEVDLAKLDLKKNDPIYGGMTD